MSVARIDEIRSAGRDPRLGRLDRGVDRALPRAHRNRDD